MSVHSDDETTFLTSNKSIQTKSTLLINNIIDNNKFSLFYSILLALGNAADAVEIMCIGYVMNEIDDITTFQKDFNSISFSYFSFFSLFLQ